jgi:CBS domain-containing protein
MLRCAKVHRQAATVAEVRALFADDHVHCALLAEAGRLVAVVERDDLGPGPAGALAAGYGTLAGRVVHPGADLAATHRSMLGQGRRRLAVVDADGMLLGLLCLKRSSLGFCSDADVAARASAARAGVVLADDQPGQLDA